MKNKEKGEEGNKGTFWKVDKSEKQRERNGWMVWEREAFFEEMSLGRPSGEAALVARWGFTLARVQLQCSAWSIESADDYCYAIACSPAAHKRGSSVCRAKTLAM